MPSDAARKGSPARRPETELAVNFAEKLSQASKRQSGSLRDGWHRIFPSSSSPILKCRECRNLAGKLGLTATALHIVHFLMSLRRGTVKIAG
jgi:hypothetical protein